MALPVSPVEIRQGMINRGLPPHVADGFMMNFQDESDFDPGINEINPIVPGSRGGFGLYQLTGPRRVAYEAFAADRGVDPSDVDAQLDFMMQELSTTEGRTLASLQNTSNAGEAGAVIVNEFLRPSEEHRANRAARYTGQQVAQNGNTANDAFDWTVINPASLSAEDRATYDAAVAAGLIPAQEEPQQEAAQPVPPTLLEAYQRGTLSPQDVATVDQALAAGLWHIPEPVAPPQNSLVAQGLDMPMPNAQGMLEGTLSPEEQAAAQAGIDAGQFQAPLTQDQQNAANAARDDRTGVNRTFIENQLRQLGLTGRAVAEGGAALLGIFSDPMESLAATLTGREQPTNGGLRARVSEQLTNLGVTEPENKAERIIQAISQAMVGGGAGVGIARGVAKLAGKSTTGNVAAQMAQAPATQVVSAGVGAGAGQGVAEEGYGTGAQLAAALAGGIGTAGIMSAPRASKGVVDALSGELPRTPAQNLVADAEARGIPVLTSDVRPPQTFAAKSLVGASERLPVIGTGPRRAVQEAARVDAIRNTLDEFNVGQFGDLAPDVIDSIAGNLRETVRNTARNYQTMKSEVFANVADAGNVPTPNAFAVIDEQIAALAGRNDATLEPAIAALRNFRNSITDQGIGNVDAARAQLGAVFNGMDMATVRNSSEKALTEVYAAVRDDIGNFIRENGRRQDYNRWRVSNARLSEGMDEAATSALRAVLRNGDATPETVQRLLFSNNRSDVARLFRNTTDQGRADARMAILQRAMEKSTAETNLGTTVSPARFASQVKKLGNQIGGFVVKIWSKFKVCNALCA